jgi:alkylation response protein AidB-like acyl-CoA dehydrogenase
MSQFDLTDEQRQIQEMAQAFTADAITPHAGEWDEKHIFPRDTIRQAAELGFGAIYVSEESGGIGLGQAGGGADHGGDGLWRSLDLGVHLDPQHGELDDRPLRL